MLVNSHHGHHLQPASTCSTLQKSMCSILNYQFVLNCQGQPLGWECFWREGYEKVTGIHWEFQDEICLRLTAVWIFLMTCSWFLWILSRCYRKESDITNSHHLSSWVLALAWTGYERKLQSSREFFSYILNFIMCLMEKYTSLIYFSVFCLHFRIPLDSEDDNVPASFIFLTFFTLPWMSSLLPFLLL